VNALDFNALASNFGNASATWVQGDYNYDGMVNALDFNAIATNFGFSLLPAPVPSAPANLGALVPEPCSIGLLTVCPLFARRRATRGK
jgi:hypothetical protein